MTRGPYMKRAAVAALLAILSASAACSRNDRPKSGGEVSRPPVAVEVQSASLSDMTEGIEVTGTLEPKFSVDVKTQIPGLVRQVLVTEWIHVRKGQLLARIDIAETEALVKRAEAGIASAKAGLAQVQVAANRAERELARILKLKESGLATQQALDDARTEAEAARVRIQAAEALLRVSENELAQGVARQSKGLVVAPIDGIVALRNINVGDLASDAATAKPVFRIVDNRLLNLTVTVPSSDSGRVKVGQSLTFTVDSRPGQTFSGRVMYLNPELSPTDRSLKVIAEFSNVPEQLKGGLFAKGRIVTGQKRGILLPRPALAAWDTAGRRATVHVIEGEVARVRSVTTGDVLGDQVEILSGIKAGESYVVRGGFNLKDGDRVQKGTGAPAQKQ